MVGDVVLEEMDEFVYIECAFNMDGRFTADIEIRVCAVNRVNDAGEELKIQF